jgi:tetracycline resistance efflux pump
LNRKNRIVIWIAAAAIIIFLIAAARLTTAESVNGTFWALTPPLIAIILALATREVYSSLFLGIVTGALLYSGFSFEGTFNHVLQDGLIGVLSDSYNVGILIFLVVLGCVVALMNRTGGSAAFGRWAAKHIKTRRGAMLATTALGVLIFIDDYFNCLTVGSVMRPVTDKHNVSRAKLAYLIDATAAPVCIIAPVSSWAAAVSGFVPNSDGIRIFIQTIPFNFYALLTICMMLGLSILRVDYGPMLKHEQNALKGDLYTTPDRPYANAEDEDKTHGHGHVIDLIFPIITIVICCVLGMLYSGGFFSGTSFVEAFAASDASVGLSLGSIFALIIVIVFYCVRRSLSFSECMDCLPAGFKAMVPAILILTFAWTLKAMTDSLGASAFVKSVVTNSASGLISMLPAIIFLIAVGISFATGTSWGTFGILIPIVVDCFEGSDYTMMIISMAACMAGSVCGDHCSPISDTTIMSSAGAQCAHMNHVTTQLPYAMTCALISFIGYIIAGFTKNCPLSLGVSIGLMIGLLAFLRVREDKRGISD